MDIKLWREGNTACTDLPIEIVDHSPSGIEWGYGVSGPADLALNILIHFTDRETAKAYHQDFKWSVIANIPFSGGTICGDFVRTWLAERVAA